MKALYLLMELRENDYQLGASKEDLKVYNEAIKELEEFEAKYEQELKQAWIDGSNANYKALKREVN